MKQTSVIFFSILVFLLALILFQTIFWAFGIVLIFLITPALLGFFWNFYRSSLFWVVLKPAFKLLLPAALAISFYSLIFLPIEFYITEISLKTPKLPSFVGISILLSLILLLTLVKWQGVFKTRSSYFTLFFFLFVSTLFYLGYRKEKLAREYLPKIYKLSPQWGVQGQIIKIEGVNFGPTFKPGTVGVDGEEMPIKFWSEKLVIAEQPIPKNFGKVDIHIIRNDGVISNGMRFQIRDPNELEN